MNWKLNTCIACSLLAGIAVAQGPDTGPRRRGAQRDGQVRQEERAGRGCSGREGQSERASEHERRRRPALVSALDVDGDHVLSAAEIDGAAAALRVLDTNGDGQLTPHELVAGGDRERFGGKSRAPGPRAHRQRGNQPKSRNLRGRR